MWADADLLHVDGAMHGRPSIGLAHGEPDLGLAGVDVCPAEDAETRAMRGRVAIAEEREVIVGHPVEKRAGFGVADGTCDVERLRTHRLPVVDGVAHIAQHIQQVGAEVGQERRVGLAIHLEVHERLADSGVVFLREVDEMTLVVAAHGDDRMHDEVDAEAVARECHRDGVDEEWHVVGDDLDDRVRRVVAVLIEGGVGDPHERLARGSIFGEPQMGARSAFEVGSGMLARVGGIQMRVVEGDEASEQARRHRDHPPGISP